MTVVASDAFNRADGAFEGSSLDVGGTWTRVSWSTDVTKPVISSNKLTSAEGSGKNSVYRSSTTITPADYSVQADISAVTGGVLAGVGGRLTTGPDQCYIGAVYQGGNAFCIFKVTAGSPTVKAQNSTSPAVGVTYRIRLSMIGTALKLYVQRLSDSLYLTTTANVWDTPETHCIDTTDTLCTAGGNVCVWISTGSANGTIDDLVADDGTAGGGGNAPRAHYYQMMRQA